MTISIEPTDFGQDIIGSVTPILGALGLLDANGSLDVNGWNLEKALGVFGTYERTEFILNMLAGYLSTPSMVYREISTGLVVEKGELSPGDVREEEWFPISKTEDWSVNLTVFHKKLDDHSFQNSSPALPNPSNPHSIEIGLGVSIDNLEIPISSGPLELSASIGIPIVEIRNQLAGSQYKIENGIPKLEVNRLIWEETGNPLARVALSGLLKPLTGDFTIGAMSSSGIALRTAFGKESSPGANDGLVLKLSLLDFVAKQGDLPSTLEIDLINLVSGGVGSILDQIVPTLIDMIPGAAGEFAEHLLPLLGLMDSDWSSWGGPGNAPNWPRIDVMALIDDIPDFDAVWVRIQNYLLALTAPEIATQWLTHLSKLIFFGNSRAPTITGNCTKDSPIALQLVDSPSLDVTLLIRIWDDVDGTKLLDVGVRASVSEEIANTVTMNGNSDVWLVSIPLSNASNRSLLFIPELELYLQLAGVGTQPLLSATAGDDGSALANLSVIIERSNLGVKLSRNRDINPVVELLNVTIGDPPSHQFFPKVDLVSGDGVMDALSGVLDAILNTISDVLAQNNVLQWLGSLVGLVAPRGYPFRYIEDEFSTISAFKKGQQVVHNGNVYKVVKDANLVVGGSMPTHQAGIEECSGIELEYLGTNQSMWEQPGANDLRIDFLRLIQDPIDEITDYYSRLIETDIDPYGTGSQPAWLYIQEALGLLINTILSYPLDFEKPLMPTISAEVIGSGTQLSPWRYELGTCTGNIPTFNLFSIVEASESGTFHEITLGTGCLASIIKINKHLHLETNLDIHLLGFKLATVNEDNIPADFTVVPKIESTIKLHDAIVYAGDEFDGTARQIPIFSRTGLFFVVDAFSVGLDWSQMDGFGFTAKIHSPRIGSIAPDFDALALQIENDADLPYPNYMSEFHWSGRRFVGPHGSIMPNLDTYHQTGSDNPVPQTIEFNFEKLENDEIVSLNKSFSIDWDFYGLGCPEIGFSSRHGMFGFISNDPASNALIDLAPGQEIIENVGVQTLLAHLMATRGGSIGFLFATFFRLHPHLLHMNLTKFIAEQGHTFSSPDYSLNVNPVWGSFYPGGKEFPSLGPFALPYDWPRLNWSNLVTQPLETINQYMKDICSGISESGEPFLFPFFRWLSGLMAGYLPNLSEPGLGWPIIYVNEQPTVTYPKIPNRVYGEGTYDNPYSVRLSNDKGSSVDFLLWLGPDGPNTVDTYDSIFAEGADEVFDLFTSEKLDIVKIEYELREKWAKRVVDVLFRLREVSPKLDKALGEFSKDYISNALLELDQLFKMGDGVSLTSSQVHGANIVFDYAEKVNSLHHRSMKNERMIFDINRFVHEYLPTNWNIETGSDGTQKTCLMFFSTQPIDDWNNCVDEILNHQKSIHGNQIVLADTLNCFYPEIETADTGQFSQPQVVFAGNQYQGGVSLVQLSQKFNHTSPNHSARIKLQILDAVSKTLQQGFDKLILIGHSVAGRGMLELADDDLLSENQILGIMTLNSPNEGTILDHSPKNVKYLIQILYQLCNSIDLNNDDTLQNQSDGYVFAEDLAVLIETLVEVSI